MAHTHTHTAISLLQLQSKILIEYVFRLGPRTKYFPECYRTTYVSKQHCIVMLMKTFAVFVLPALNFKNVHLACVVLGYGLLV